ncbi:MAG: hypothetical protein HMLKMBBP_02871 [Planctomycetes bacterium]|nr:hypothetical protein [Planctomycetota bacterium]
MIALAFDTSGAVGTVAVLRADGPGAPQSVLAEETIGAGMRRGVDLFPAMERALRRARVSPREIDVVAVGTGPGSYTGLRVGVTAARAFAYACGAALLGVPSCDAWADGADGSAPGEDRLAVVLDSQAGPVYFALFERRGADEPWVRTEGPEILAAADAAARIPQGTRLVGDGPAANPGVFAAPRQGSPDHAGAVHIARRAVARALRGERDAIESVTPLYLRTPAYREQTHG